MKKHKQSDTFLYQLFKRTDHSPNDISVQPMEKLTYQENSSARLKIIKRHETDGWLVVLGLNEPLIQYFSLYLAVSQKEGQRREK